MRALGRSIASLVLLAFLTSAEVIRFDGSAPGNPPPGWSFAMTHDGAPPQWQVLRDKTAPSPPNVLAQISTDKTAGRFPLAVWDGKVFRNGEIRVAFKTVGGVVDQAAGIVWRYQDQNNYYIVRANALENNVVLYKVENGVRTSIAPKGLPSRSYGVKHDVPKGRWSTLAVVFKDALFGVFFDGQRLFEIEDHTFTKSGKAGLWTKADSVTYFDDFSITVN